MKNETDHFETMRKLILEHVPGAKIGQMLECLAMVQLTSIDRLMVASRALEQAAVMRHAELRVQAPAAVQDDAGLFRQENPSTPAAAPVAVVKSGRRSKGGAQGA